MIYQLRTFPGEVREFTRPQKVQLSLDRDAPAHSLEARFPLPDFNREEGLPEYHSIQIIKDGEVFFRGLIDEQEVAIDSGGVSLQVCARSLAALLLDNEAIPQTYYVPSAKLIYQRHAQPYGFPAFSGRDKAFSAKLQIDKGTSEWEVIESFCRDHLGARPQVTLAGELQMEPAPLENQALFSNVNGIPYASVSERYLPCKRVSRVLVRSQRLGGYSTLVQDSQAVESGILRRRLLNAVDDPKTPVFRGQQVLQKSREQSYQVELLCPGEWILDLGTRAVVENPVLGALPGLRVDSLSYRLDSSGERTQVTLGKEWEA